MAGSPVSKAFGSHKRDVRKYLMLSGLYLFVYYAFGALYPLLSQYYKSIHLTGTQIGMISAVPPVVSIVAQPVWGMICDRYQIRKPILVLALTASAMVALLFTMVSSFAWVLFLFIVFSMFQCAVVPVSDSMALTYAKRQHMQFGSIRMWGAVGFAVAAYLTGLAVQAWGPNMLFYFYSTSFFLAILFMRSVPGEAEETRFGSGVFDGLKELLRLPRFVLFLIGCFCLFGSVNANNIWFSLYYQHIGGSVAGVGLAFFLFAGSEAPFMKAAGYLIRRWGLEVTLLIAATVSVIRWFWYGSAPSTALITACFFLQGASVGFYLASAAQYVRENTPSHLQVTALALFSAFGQGLGSMTCNLVAGVIADYAGILSVYRFFGIASTIGLIPLLLITFGPWKNR
jgi:PPP family 3-phenylpropionic acid transporter